MITINQFLKCIHLQQQWASLSSIIPPSMVLPSVFFNQLFSVALRQTIQICSSSVFLCSVHLYLWCLWTLLPSTSPSIMAFSRLLMYGVTIVPCISHFYFLQQNHVAFSFAPAITRPLVVACPFMSFMLSNFLLLNCSLYHSFSILFEWQKYFVFPICSSAAQFLHWVVLTLL